MPSVPLPMVDELFERVAVVLGLTLVEVRAMSILTLRTAVKGRSEQLAKELTLAIRDGVRAAPVRKARHNVVRSTLG